MCQETGCSHGHHELTGCIGNDTPYPSLYPYIRHDSIRTLNEKDLDSGKSIFKPYNDRHSELSVTALDTELIIHVPFTEAVKLMGISICAGPPLERIPQKMALFVNREELDFATIQDVLPAQEIALAAELELVYYPLK